MVSPIQGSNLDTNSISLISGIPNPTVNIPGLTMPDSSTSNGRSELGRCHNLTGAGTFTTRVTDTDGIWQQLDSGTTANNWRGLRTAAVITNTDWNPYIAMRFKLGTTTNKRFYIGWFDVNTTLSNDTFMDGNDGAMLCARPGDSNFFINHNDVGATAAFTDTGIAVDTNPHIFEMRIVSSIPELQWRMDGSSWSSITTDIPRPNINLFWNWVWNTTDTTDRAILWQYIFTTSDK